MKSGTLSNLFCIIIPASKYIELLCKYLLNEYERKRREGWWGCTKKMRGDLEHCEGIGLGLDEGHIFLCEERQGGKFGGVCREVCMWVQGCVAHPGFHGWWLLSDDVICWQFRWKFQRLSKWFEQNGRDLEQLLRGVDKRTHQHFETAMFQAPCWVLKLYRWGGCDIVFAFQEFTIQRRQTFYKKVKMQGAVYYNTWSIAEAWWGQGLNSESGGKR